MAVWDKALFDSLYDVTGWRWGVRNFPRRPRFHYNWFVMRDFTDKVFASYQVVPGFAQVSDVAIIGGGYGWSAELLRDIGINAISVDTSPHIINTANTSEEQELRDKLTADGFDPDNLPVLIGPDYNTPVNPWDYWLRPDGVRTSVTIVDEDMSTSGSRRAVVRALNNNVDAIVTEIALDSMESDADALAFIERCEQLRPNPACNVIHLVMNGHSADGFLSYSTNQWRTFLDNNQFNHYVLDLSGNILPPGG